MWKMITELFQGFMGTGLIMGWYLLALVYLWFAEKDRRRRVLLVYAPLAVLALYFNPLFARLVYGAVGDEIYYRILWLAAAGNHCGGLCHGRSLRAFEGQKKVWIRGPFRCAGYEQRQLYLCQSPLS